MIDIKGVIKKGRIKKDIIKKESTLCKRFIVTSYISIVVSVILISIVSYLLLSQNARKYMVQANEQVVLQKKSGISMRLEGLETTFRDITYNAEVQKLLRWEKQQERGERDLNALRIRMNQAITGVANSFMMLDNMIIFSANGDVVGSLLGFDTGKNAQEYSWYETAQSSGGETCWLNNEIQISWDYYGGHITIPVVKKIRSIHAEYGVNIGEDLGYFYGILNLDSVLNFVHLEYPIRGRQVFITNDSGTIISSSDKNTLEQTFDISLMKKEYNNTYVTYQEEPYLFTYQEVPFDTFSWYVVCMTPKSEILKDANIAVGICFLVSFVLLLVFLFFSIQNAKVITAPFKTLEERFEKVEKGEFDIPESKNYHIMEIDRLFSRFHVMVYRLDTLIREVYEARIKEQKLLGDAREAEIQALQMQINPHFLYNTLDSINWMALMQGNKEISKMTLALGHLFRANMSTTGIYTTMKEELEYIRLFMYLEQVRFEDKLSYEIDVPDELMNVQVVKHLLQPLVENSIKYGIEPYNIKGVIRIRAWEEEKKICMEISNNGKEMKAEKCKELNELWEQISSEQTEMMDAMSKDNATKAMLKGKGVGIPNIMKRLWLCYGKEVQVSIISGEEIGTVTKISFPMK